MFKKSRLLMLVSALAVLATACAPLPASVSEEKDLSPVSAPEKAVVRIPP